jgi:hypothetical protein
MRRALIAAPIALLLATAPSAHAANASRSTRTLDVRRADEPARLRCAGTALVTWTSGDANTPKVCAIRSAAIA